MRIKKAEAVSLLGLVLAHLKSEKSLYVVNSFFAMIGFLHLSVQPQVRGKG